MERRSRVGIALRTTGVAFATFALSNATVNHWNHENPDNFLNFSFKNYQKFYEANSGWEALMPHILMLDFVVLLVVPVVIVVLALRYVATGKLRKNPPTAKCCEHCKMKTEAVSG